MVKAFTDLREKILLCIARARFFIFAPVRGHKATRRGGHDAVIVRHQKTRQIAAAGVAHATEPFGVHLRPASEIIQRAHTVPHHPTAQPTAQQNRRRP